MKVREVLSKENSLTYNSVRHNSNITGTHLLCTEGKPNEEKIDYGNLMLFSLMGISGYIDEIKLQNPNITPKELVEKMIEKANILVEKGL